MMWNGYNMMGWGFGGWIMGIIFLVVFVAAILAIFFAFRNKSSFNCSESALEILKKRYAKGEISKEDYEKIKKDL